MDRVKRITVSFQLWPFEHNQLKRIARRRGVSIARLMVKQVTRLVSDEQRIHQRRSTVAPEEAE